jgi:formate hydrogenlyase subunit 6/NADH:ubiquinone oxidoreductase subunit I
MFKVLSELVNTKVVTEGIAEQNNYTKRLPVVNFEGCPDGCKRCLEDCPTGALSAEGVNPLCCIYCWRCKEACLLNRITTTEIPVISAQPNSELGQVLREKIKKVCRGSLHIRYVNAGACNGCDFEINALTEISK